MWCFLTIQVCAHTFFDELREPATKLPNGRDLPPLFNFTDSELRIQPALNSQLLPPHVAAAQAANVSAVAGAGGSADEVGSDAASAVTASASASSSAGTKSGVAGATTQDESMNQGSPSGGTS